MAKKLVADKVELKTPFVKKKDEVLKSVGKDLNIQFIKDELENVFKEDFDSLLPIGEPPVENNVEEILQDIIPISVEEFVLENILNSVDSLQTIERGKLDLVKELILNSQNLEAISLLKSIQTAENWKVNEIISKL